MKTNLTQTLCLVLCFVSCSTFAHMLTSRTVSVGVEENVSRKTASQYTVTETVVLQIKLRGKPLASESRTMKWTAYGRDRKTRDISVIDSGETKVDFSASETQKLEPVNISTTSTKAHTVSKRQGRRSSVQRVEGSGVQYVGFGVQVLEGDKVVGEKFQPDKMEEDIKISVK